MRLTLSHIYVVPSFFKEKEGTEEKPFGEKLRFSWEGFFVKVKYETGYRPSPSRHPHGAREKGFAKGRSFVFRPFPLG